MGRKQKNKINLDWSTKEASISSNQWTSARNLRKTDLGAVIFGTTHNTINECLSRQLFGLPEGHYSYIKNIKPGLVLFLFNYSDRMLHGVFEAAGPGQLNIDRYAWVADGDESGYTRYPAQVKICVKQLCHPLSEEQFQPIIAPNYYDTKKHFHFELDTDQTNKLISLFTSQKNSIVSTKWNNLYTSLPPTPPKTQQQIVSTSPSITKNLNHSSSQHVGKWSALFTSSEAVNDVSQVCEEKGDFLETDNWEEWGQSQTWETDLNLEVNADVEKENVMEGNTWEESDWNEEVEWVETLVADSNSAPITCEDEVEDVKMETESVKDGSLVPNTDEMTSTDVQGLVAKLKQENEEMKGSQLKMMVKFNRLEQELDTSKEEIQQLKNRVTFLESGSQSADPFEVEDQLPSKFTDSVLIVGGHDGSTWLPALDSYVPSEDIKVSLSPMTYTKRYASAAMLNGELYQFGGGGSHTVESFNPTTNEWTERPPLFWKNINVAGASVKDRLYAVGGAMGSQYSSEVEYLDMNIGKWLPACSMQSKRLAPAAAELNNVLYVSGGYDGVSYLSSVERFDPREEGWFKIANMNTMKGCHSMVVLNEKLYTIGGFGGDQYIPTVEYLDTRMGAWVEAEPMNVSRGNFGAFVLKGKLYTIGGRNDNDEVLDIVECYKEGSWEVVDNMKAIGKRSHFSAFVM